MEGTNFEDSNPTQVDLSNNETFAVCEEHASHENSSEGTSIGENQIENMFSKQMYLSNFDFKKRMQMMKNVGCSQYFHRKGRRFGKEIGKEI